jgi:hypothetical protein
MLSCFFFWPTSAQPGSVNESSKRKATVEYAKTLSEQKLIRYINQLGKKKDFARLKAIYNCDFPNSQLAAKTYSRILESEKAIAFCTRLEIGSINWRAAVFGLAYHPKDQVIGYLKQLATSSIAEARWCCYEVCLANKWNDLLTLAKADLNNKTKVEVVGIFESTIGEVASKYINGFPKKQQKQGSSD